MEWTKRNNQAFLQKTPIVLTDLGPSQTRREIVVDNYLVVDDKKLSITKEPVCEASYIDN